MTDIEILAVEQAIYNMIGADVSTKDPYNLRARVNAAYRDLYEQTGATSFEVRVNGEKVGTYSFARKKGTPERVVSGPVVTDPEKLRADDRDDWLDWCRRYIDAHIVELATEYATETGELLDGMELVTETVPATPDTVRPSGTLRVHPQMVAEALGNALPSTIAGLLGGA